MALVRRRRPQPSEHLGEEQFLAVSGVQLSSERIWVVVGQCRMSKAMYRLMTMRAARL